MYSVANEDKMTVSEETIETINAISTELQTGLDSNSLESIATLISCGVHPDALSALILELRREMEEQPRTR